MQNDQAAKERQLEVALMRVDAVEYAEDARVVLKVVRRWWGDEASAVLAAALRLAGEP